jgi:hypothetical protein
LAAGRLTSSKGETVDDVFVGMIVSLLPLNLGDYRVNKYERIALLWFINDCWKHKPTTANEKQQVWLGSSVY